MFYKLDERLTPREKFKKYLGSLRCLNRRLRRNLSPSSRKSINTLEIITRLDISRVLNFGQMSCIYAIEGHYNKDGH